MLKNFFIKTSITLFLLLIVSSVILFFSYLGRTGDDGDISVSSLEIVSSQQGGVEDSINTLANQAIFGVTPRDKNCISNMVIYKNSMYPNLQFTYDSCIWKIEENVYKNPHSSTPHADTISLTDYNENKIVFNLEVVSSYEFSDKNICYENIIEQVSDVVAKIESDNLTHTYKSNVYYRGTSQFSEIALRQDFEGVNPENATYCRRDEPDFILSTSYSEEASYSAVMTVGLTINNTFDDVGSRADSVLRTLTF